MSTQPYTHSPLRDVAIGLAILLPILGVACYGMAQRPSPERQYNGALTACEHAVVDATSVEPQPHRVVYLPYGGTVPFNHVETGVGISWVDRASGTRVVCSALRIAGQRERYVVTDLAVDDVAHEVTP